MRRWVLLLTLACAAARADEPPAWRPFSVCTNTGRFCAYARPPLPEQRTLPDWTVTVSERDVEGSAWTVPITHDGYDGGYLTEDGSTFVTVSFWYFDTEPVVRIYRSDATRTIDGKAFGIPEEALIDTVSHRVWLASDREAVALRGLSELEIVTVDGRSHVIDLRTGGVEASP